MAVVLIFFGYFAANINHLVMSGTEENGDTGMMAAENLYETAGELVLAVLPGAGCILISFLTREALGYGDGIVIMVHGLGMGFTCTVEWLLLGFFLSAIWAVYLCVFRKADRKKEFPFLPFLLGAFVIEMVCLYSG
jgi:prepilin signal peptidase PulO-like enzyme (type II secretory pathway)